MPQRTVGFVMDGAWASATARVRGQLMNRALSVTNVDVAAKDRCLEDESGEEQNEEKLHAAVAPHAVSQGF